MPKVNRKVAVPPLKAWPGDRVLAMPHRGEVHRGGKVMGVETHYSLRNPPYAYHLYRVRFDGNKRCEWHGDDAILSVHPEDSHG